jgi:NTE family protein
MNAAVMISGLERGGRADAKASLEAFWRAVADAATLSPIQRSPLDVILGRWSLDSSPAYLLFDLAAHVEFERLAASPIKLFVTATTSSRI